VIISLENPLSVTRSLFAIGRLGDGVGHAANDFDVRPDKMPRATGQTLPRDGFDLTRTARWIKKYLRAGVLPDASPRARLRRTLLPSRH
jgi:hypothetical protein